MTLIAQRDFGVGLYAPGLEVIVGGTAAKLRAIDPELVTVFNRRIGRFEIYDRAAPGGPKWQLVMRVQEPDGSFRPLDDRVLRPIYEARGRSVDELIDQMEAREAERDRQWDRRVKALGEDMYEIAWSMGKRVVSTVAWRDRTPPEARARLREQIRAAATPREVALA